VRSIGASLSRYLLLLASRTDWRSFISARGTYECIRAGLKKNIHTADRLGRTNGAISSTKCGATQAWNIKRVEIGVSERHPGTVIVTVLQISLLKVVRTYAYAVTFRVLAKNCIRNDVIIGLVRKDKSVVAIF
jgi:hypothetical protein